MKTVWVVDDDPAIRVLLQMALERMGAQVTCFSSVSAVRSAIRAGHPHPDVCLADWTLNDGPVTDLHPLMPHVRFVVMSGNPVVEEGLPADILWLPKPFRLEQLSGVALA